MFKKRLITLCLVIAGTAISSEAIGQAYLNTSLSHEQRARDLISKLTLEEKVSQMMNSSAGIDRLNILPYNWWNEALHGVGRSAVATVFPQAIALGATFDADLAYRVSSAISDEARAIYNLSSSKGYYNQYNGLSFWTPNVNIFRDPRWGRGQETYGEDPFLTAELGVAFVRGLQGDDPDYLKTAACAKHFAVHSGPEKVRHEFNAITSQKDLYETYLPAFKALVDADVEAVMCAYNRTNGEPCCAHNYLLDEVLRGDWGFDGHVVTDCEAVTDFYSPNGHHTVNTKAEAAALAVNHDVNLNCGSEFTALLDAVDQGLLDEKTLDEALLKLLITRFKLGMFDAKEDNPFASLGAETINSSANRALAREVANKSMVLLKNNGVLPLKNDLSRYFVTGPNAAGIEPLIGNYYGVNPDMVTILEGIAKAVAPGSQVQYNQGVLLDRQNVNPIDWSSGTAKTADATFYVMGITAMIEGEEGAAIASPDFGDRLDYNIPKSQIDYLKKLVNQNPNPVIAIVTGGSPMNLAEVHELADAVLLAWYPGEEGGNAVADILFGKVAPSGKLPITFPKSLDQLPAYEDYSMIGRTYKYMEAEPLYPFGFGLGYAKIIYSGLKLSSTKVKKGQQITATVTLTNEGDVKTDEIVQFYLKDEVASERVPLFDLKGMKRVTLTPGERKEITFDIAPDMLYYVGEDGNKKIEKGTFKFFVGGSLPTKRSTELGASSFVEATFNLK